MGIALSSIAVGFAIFALGIALAVRKFGSQNRIAFMAVAIVTPFVAVFAVFRVITLAISGKASVEPCPMGLAEAESMVEHQRQQMFGGLLRTPSLTRTWQRAYERELRKDTGRVKDFAQRHFAVAR